MPLIVCQVIADKPGQLTFTWSDGTNPFEPYALSGLLLAEFTRAAKAARAALSELVGLHLEPQPPELLRQAGHDLAVAGHALYRATFAPDADQLPRAAAVRDWLDALRQQDEPAVFEIVVEADLYVPWNLVYDQPPPPTDAFLLPATQDAPWLPFWGVRYDLACGRRVNPLRRLPAWERPDVILVIDPEIRDSLPDEPPQRRRLASFAAARSVRLVETHEQLTEALKGDRPYLLYWLSHATPDALVLGGDAVKPAELLALLRGDVAAPAGRRGLLFLNACQTGKGGRAGSFLDAVFSAGLSGLIATEEFTLNTYANTFGLDFLEAFLDSGKSVGEILHTLRRGGLPLGLLYTAYCPPAIQIPRPVSDPAVGPPPPQKQAPGLPVAPPQPLPDNPYRGLAPYRREHRPLFAGRDLDVQRFAELVNEPGARLLVLHGELGVGKSSFLSAGLLPYLEEECVGYRVLRNQSDAAGDDAPALFIRAGRDLVGQTAKALCDFAARSYCYRTPDGKDVEVPLGTLLSAAMRSAPSGPLDPPQVRAAIAADPALPGRFLAVAGEALPFGLVVVIDQVEEVFTLAKNESDVAARSVALAMLRRAVETPGDFKIVLALRTDYLGRLTDALRTGLRDLRGVREYLLTDLGEAELIEAILRPASEAPAPHSSSVPRQKYQFSYASGVAERIAQEARQTAQTANDSALLMLQLTCSRLYEVVRHRDDRTVTDDDVKKLGGTRAHAEALLARLVEVLPVPAAPAPSRRRLLDRLFARAGPAQAELVALKRLFRRLYARQSDGRVTSALVPADELARRWRGRSSFEDVVATASSDEFRLMRESHGLSGEQERRYLSLGHDSLAPVAAAWDEEVEGAARVHDALAMGFFLAAVALALIGGLSIGALLLAEKTAGKELVADSHLSSALAAEFAAEKLPWKVRRIWQLMQSEAAEATDLPAWLNAAESPQARASLQRWAEGRFAANVTRIKGLKSWVVLDHNGVQVANSEQPGLVGEDFSYRDYFHGTGSDVPEGRGKWGGIRRPHLSNRFLPINDESPRVACSVPILVRGRVVGVLTVTLNPGDFLDPPEGFQGEQRLILFVDRNGDVADACGCGGLDRIPDSTREQLEAGESVVRGLGEREGDGPWVAGYRRVKFDRGGETDPGWSVVVAEPRREVLRPLARLRRWLFAAGAGAMALTIAVLGVLMPLLARRLRPTGLLLQGLVARGAAEPRALVVTIHGPGGQAWQGQVLPNNSGDQP